MECCVFHCEEKLECCVNIYIHLKSFSFRVPTLLYFQFVVGETVVSQSFC